MEFNKNCILLYHYSVLSILCVIYVKSVDSPPSTIIETGLFCRLQSNIVFQSACLRLTNSLSKVLVFGYIPDCIWILSRYYLDTFQIVLGYIPDCVWIHSRLYLNTFQIVFGYISDCPLFVKNDYFKLYFSKFFQRLSSGSEPL